MVTLTLSAGTPHRAIPARVEVGALGLLDVKAPAGSRLTLVGDGGSRTVDLYSAEGVQLVASLWLKLSAEYRLMYEPTWLGVPIIQLPDDIVMMQELIWNVRPDVIVECGVAHGGATVLYASLCALIGKGRVVGVDIEIRKHNRVVLENHPMAHRIDLIEGSSIDPSVVSAVRERVAGAGVVLVALDSNHSRAHVREELEQYSSMVTPGSYIVAMDGAQGQVSDIPRGKPEWDHDNPLPAIHDFLANHAEFVSDPHYTRLHVTSNPNGYLRRLPHADLKGR